MVIVLNTIPVFTSIYKAFFFIMTSYFNVRDDFCQLFNRFQLFSSENCFPKVAGHSQNRSKMTILKGGVYGFSFFSLISVILFTNQDHP